MSTNENENGEKKKKIWQHQLLFNSSIAIINNKRSYNLFFNDVPGAKLLWKYIVSFFTNSWQKRHGKV